MIISTIEAPLAVYQRPATLLSDLGYPAGANPSDDQILLDVIMHVPEVKGAIAVATTPLAIIRFASLGLPFAILPEMQQPQGGDLNLPTANYVDREWIAQTFLIRSTNQVPKKSMTEDDLAKYADPFAGDYRLVNRVDMGMSIAGGIPNWTKKQSPWALIGPTRLNFQSQVTVQVKYTQLILGLPAGTIATLNIPVPQLFTRLPVPNFQFAVKWGNDAESINGSVAPNSYVHRNAARIGPLLQLAEHYILNEFGRNPYSGRGHPGPFWNEIILSPTSGANGLAPPIIPQYKVCNWHSILDPTGSIYSNDPTPDPSWCNIKINWPTHHVYHFDFGLSMWVMDSTETQVNSPFSGFIRPYPPGQ